MTAPNTEGLGIEALHIFVLRLKSSKGTYSVDTTASGFLTKQHTGVKCIATFVITVASQHRLGAEKTIQAELHRRQDPHFDTSQNAQESFRDHDTSESLYMKIFDKFRKLVDNLFRTTVFRFVLEGGHEAGNFSRLSR